MIIDIKDKVCLITGASRGLGREMALKLAEEGTKLIINYNKIEKEVLSLVNLITKRFSSECTAIQADVTNEKL